jgi:hypothetical protein
VGSVKLVAPEVTITLLVPLASTNPVLLNPETVPPSE